MDTGKNTSTADENTIVRILLIGASVTVILIGLRLAAILAVPLTLAVKKLVLESSDESRWLAVLMEPGVSEEPEEA